MTKKFDPYYKWLGIPPRDQPPHHYRLLGIEIFESDRDVIDAAANRVMAYLKDLAAGDEAEYSQQLLNEVSRARICLLNKDKKTAYDEELRAELKSKGTLEPKGGKPAAKPPAKKRKNGGKTEPPAQPPIAEPFPKIRVEAPPRKSAQAAMVLAEPDEAGEQPSKEKKPARPDHLRRKRILAFVAGGGGVLVAGLVVVAVLLFSGPGNNWVASGHNGGTEQNGDEATTANTAGSGSEGNPQSEPGTGVESDPQTDPGPTAKTSPKRPAGMGGRVPSEGEPKPKVKPGAIPATEIESDLPDWTPEPKVSDDGSASGSPKPKAEPGPSDAGNPKGKGSLPDDNTLAKVDLPGAKPPKQELDIPQPPAKPTQPPFAELPQTITLPDLEAADGLAPLVIGAIRVAAGELCFIKLRGGENAIKGSQTLVMRNADGGLAERDWEVFSREGESGPETKIAHLSINDQSQLTFQWQPEAKTLPLSAHLCNCAFSFNSSGESHVLTLRQPSQAEAMKLDLGKPSTTDHWTIEAAPNPAAVKIEITGVTGSDYTVTPTPIVEANKGETWIELKEGGGLLVLKFETEMKRNVEVTVTPHVKTPQETKPQKFNARLFTQALGKLRAQLAQSPFFIQRMKQAASLASGREKTVAEQRVAQAEQAQVELQAAVENAQKLEDFLKTASGSLQIQFRVFYDAVSAEVDLLRVGGGSVPDTGS